MKCCINRFIGFIKSCLAFLKSVFLSGLFTIIPIAFTVFFISFAYGFVYKFLEPLRRLQPGILKSIPGSEFILATTLILFIGFVLKVFIIHSIVSTLEEVINKIPLIRIIYSSAKMLVNFFQVPKHAHKTREVVLIPFPRKGNYHLAFLLESAEDSYQQIIPDQLKTSPEQKFFKVFMPTSPNPTTGYFLIVPEDEIIYTQITFEEAIKTLVSCGLITPESLKRGH